MSILRAKDVEKMDEKTKKDKLKSLKMELVKANVTANKTNAKNKEIKKAIARLLTSLNEKNVKITKDQKSEVKRT